MTPTQVKIFAKAAGKRPGVGYSELKRMDKGRDSTFVFDDDSDADQATLEQTKTASLKPEILVTVPVNNFSKWAFSLIGPNYPDWPIFEKEHHGRLKKKLALMRKG
jgi:hypothetical protein